MSDSREQWGTLRGWAELVLSGAEGKGKAGPLEAGNSSRLFP
jgi:hypothetical protein